MILKGLKAWFGINNDFAAQIELNKLKRKESQFSEVMLSFFDPFKWVFPILFILDLSCTKVIDVSLNNASKKLVIEGVITNEAGKCEVKISNTLDFNQTSAFSGVSGARVTVKENGGAAVNLAEITPGVYQTAAISGVPGHTYSLQVDISGQTFSATSTMPVPVNLDSLFIQELNGFGDATKYVNVVFRDPPGKGNAYHFILYRNSKKEKTIFIINDDFSDGKLNNILLVNFANNTTDDEIKSADSLQVEMQCVDTPVYQFWYSLDQNSTGTNNNASPGNPVSNLSGGALGYFSAHTTQTRSFVAP